MLSCRYQVYYWSEIALFVRMCKLFLSTTEIWSSNKPISGWSSWICLAVSHCAKLNLMKWRIVKIWTILTIHETYVLSEVAVSVGFALTNTEKTDKMLQRKRRTKKRRINSNFLPCFVFRHCLFHRNEKIISFIAYWPPGNIVKTKKTHFLAIIVFCFVFELFWCVRYSDRWRWHFCRFLP